jgi:hypothetical protein
MVVGGLLVATAFALMATGSSAVAGAPVTGAVSTTTNVDATTGNGACLNGGGSGDPVNCNIYSSKEDVWLSGLPISSSLGSGTYFFSVMVPGGQADPNDGSANNLSNSDAYTDRTFSVDSSGAITNLGTHQLQNGKVQLFPYDDTTNPGGVYIMGVCKIDDPNSYPVDPSSCKYDAFKVQQGADQPVAKPLTVTKDANGSYDKTYTWGIGKSVDKTRVEQVGGTATFEYTVTAEHGAGAVSNVQVNGTITVFNPNIGSVSGVDVADTLSDGTVCSVSGGSQATIPGSGDKSFGYSCSLPAKPYGELDNTVTATWADQIVDPDGSLAAGSADFTFSSIEFAQTLIDDCATVTDSFGPHAGTAVITTLGTVCVGDTNPMTFSYSRVITIPTYNCLVYDNTATFTTNTTGTTGSSGASVTVCGPVKTGALTMGFWQNKNGQAIITKGSSTSGACNSGTWLRQYAPFQSLSATASCAAVGTYVTGVIKAATCGGSTCNAMLKSQMLATALDVYFSDASLGGNKISAPRPIGGVVIDLTKVCHMIDGSGGVASCSGTYEDVSSAFGGAASLTVSQMLDYAGSQSNAGGSIWYGQVKATQTLAKDAFDAINNQVAFGAAP